jgi:biotin synthase
MQDYSLRDINELRQKPLLELMSLALAAKLAARGPKMSFCGIVNAKSGNCSEDCKFCVQSGRHQTDIPVYPLKSADEIIDEAWAAAKNGAERFSIVTSGRGLGEAEVEKVAAMVAEITERVGIGMCASLGILPASSLQRLKEAGLLRYHHNLESSREFFPNIATTHTFEERVATIRAAKEAGLEVCAGGIIGMGETEDDRISMAFSLRECGADSVPINVLMPLPGTPLADLPPLPVRQVLRAIALYRLIMPRVPIRLAAGRETALKDFMGMALMAGADSMMIGGYLTQRGRLPEEDHRLAREMQDLWSE